MHTVGTRRSVEDTLVRWAQPPAASEQQRCENAITAIRNAINRSDKLRHRSLYVFTQGSYRNRVNVRQDSDVDVGVLCDETFMAKYPPGMTREDFGHSAAPYQYLQFKDELEAALVEHFGRNAVRRGNKAFDIRENSYRVDADVAPFFEYREYSPSGVYTCGVALRPDNGGRIHNYPERLREDWPQRPLHYENGVRKNTATHRAFKGVVRIVKKLRNEMADAGVVAAEPIPGFLSECLVWNAPENSFLRDSWEARMRAVLADLRIGTRDDAGCRTWTEVNGIKPLFGVTQAWTRHEAHRFVEAASSYLRM